MVDGETNEVLVLEGAENGNGMMNRNQFSCQEEWLNTSGTFYGPRDPHLRGEVSSNENNEFVNNLFEQNVFFHEENVDQGIAMHDSNFQAWTQQESGF
jgi:hypothetical protein